MKQFFRDYFSFNKRERNGILILLSIIVFLIIYLNLSYLLFTPKKVDFTSFEQKIKTFDDSLEQQKDSSFNENRNYKSFSTDNTTNNKAERFSFNPNNLPEKDWQRMGFTDKQIHTIKNYESKGGKFRTKADVKKMYCIKENQYLSLEPFIEIPEENKTVKLKAERFNFNPNNLPEKDWQRLGFTDKQISTIKNYESKGGKFRTKEDVKKMYCIKSEVYQSLEPYIQIPDKNKTKDSIPKLSPSKLTPSIIELNTADSLQLITIRGIKAFYSKAIIKYRNQLGGFVAKEQLMEIWKFDKEKYDAIQNQVTVNTALIKKININTANAQELKHPYLTQNMVGAIINYRKQHGMYLSIEDIKKTDLVDDETYRKIAPYLTIN